MRSCQHRHLIPAPLGLQTDRQVVEFTHRSILFCAAFFEIRQTTAHGGMDPLIGNVCGSPNKCLFSNVFLALWLRFLDFLHIFGRIGHVSGRYREGIGHPQADVGGPIEVFSFVFYMQKCVDHKTCTCFPVYFLLCGCVSFIFYVFFGVSGTYREGIGSVSGRYWETR